MNRAPASPAISDTVYHLTDVFDRISRIDMTIGSPFDDLRQALRSLARAKGTTTVILLSLALGTGVNAAVHGVLDALLLRAPTGVASPARLVNIYTSEFSGQPYGLSSYADFLSLTSGAAVFESIAAIDDQAVENVRLGEAAQSARVAAVSPGFFAMLQMAAHSGRLLDEGTAVEPPPAVVSFSVAERFGGSAQIVGKTAAIGERTYTIVGVTPPRFQGLVGGRACDAWIPMASSASRGDRRLAVVGRLATGVTVDAAANSLRQISDALAAQYPATNRGSLLEAEAPRRITPVRFSQLDPSSRDQIALIGLVIGGAAAALLAGACLNVGSLLLSRGVARQRDVAIKLALGATPAILARQSLIETLCLALGGGGLGLLCALWTGRAIPALFMVEQAERLDTALDAGVILLTVGVAGIAGAVFGIGPALQGIAPAATTTLRGDAGGVSASPGGVRWRSLLVGTQVALSTMLLLATGLLVSSLTQALAGELTTTIETVAIASIELPGRFEDPVRGVASRGRLLEQVAASSGIDAVGWASTLPLGRGNHRRFRIESAAGTVTDTVEFDTNVVSPGYFRALALVRVEGRFFDDRDTIRARPVVVIDELLARRYFGPTAVGRQLIDAEGMSAEIVGVVRGGRYRTLQQAPQPTVYYASTQDYLWRGHLIARAKGDPAAQLATIRAVVERDGDGATILRASTMSGYLSEALTIDRLTTTLVGLCGVIALAMAAIGVYGVMTDAVQRRTREIGLRMALGAGRRQVARLVFEDVTYLAAAGLVTGTIAAVVLSQVGRLFVHGVPSLDLATVTAASGALAAAIAIAAVIPLRRALRVSPNIALRAEHP